MHGQLALRRRSARRRSPRVAGTPVHVYSAAMISRAVPRARSRRLRRYPHRLHYAIKANATLGDRPTDARARRARGRQLGRRNRGRAARGIRAGEKSCSPASARRATSSSAPSAWACGAINAESPGEVERIDAIAQRARAARPRRRARQSGRRCRQPSAHLDRPSSDQVRHVASTRPRADA